MPCGGPQEGEEGGLKMLALEGVGYLACTLEQWKREGGRGVRRWDDAVWWWCSVGMHTCTGLFAVCH